MGLACARLFALLTMTTVAVAQASEPGGQLRIELNTIADQDNSCLLTFMVTNGQAAAIDQLVYEAVLFDSAGQVDRLTLFDFGALPEGVPRVRQFAVPDLRCDGLSRVLFNGLHSCTASGAPPEICAGPIAPSSRTDVEVLG